MSSRVRNISIEDLYRLRPVSKPCISPDGQRVAFVVTTIDERKYEYRSSIWVVSTGGGEGKPFTTGRNNAHSPSWAPDGTWLAFFFEAEGEPANPAEKKQKKQGKDKPPI